MKIQKDASQVGFYELLIPCVKKSDAGKYSCVAFNRHGNATSEARVTVTGMFSLFLLKLKLDLYTLEKEKNVT